jgi:ribosome recycling factor
MLRAAAAPLRAAAPLARAASSAALPRARVVLALPVRGPKSGGKAAKGAPAAAAAAAPAPSADDVEEDGPDLKAALARHVDYARRELAKLRGGAPSPTMLDHVTVEAYGERSSLPDVAQIALKGPALIVVNPFDPANANAIADAIRDAGLNLNPAVDGALVRVPIPKTSKETRDATLKLVSKVAEAAKTRARRARADALERLKKATGVSEDDVRRETKAVEEATTAAVAEIGKIADKKRADVEAA